VGGRRVGAVMRAAACGVFSQWELVVPLERMGEADGVEGWAEQRRDRRTMARARTKSVPNTAVPTPIATKG